MLCPYCILFDVTAIFLWKPFTEFRSWRHTVTAEIPGQEFPVHTHSGKVGGGMAIHLPSYMCQSFVLYINCNLVLKNFQSEIVFRTKFIIVCLNVV